MELRKDVGAPSQDITVSLRDSWNGTVLGSAVISSDALTTNMAWYAFSIGDVVLNDGVTYYIRITTDTTAGLVFAAYDNPASYSNGDKLDDNGVGSLAEKI